MWRALTIWIVILNLSSTPLHDAIELGDIGIDESRKVEIDSVDSVRVVFRLGDEWIGTDMLPRRDTIEISDKIETFEMEVEIVE